MNDETQPTWPTWKPIDVQPKWVDVPAVDVYIVPSADGPIPVQVRRREPPIAEAVLAFTGAAVVGVLIGQLARGVVEWLE